MKTSIIHDLKHPGICPASLTLLLRKTGLLCLFILLSVSLWAEGTKQLEPAGENPALKLAFYNDGWTMNGYRIGFALPGCDTSYRLHVRISNFATEKIYFGFNQGTDQLTYQLRDPDGLAVYSSFQQVPTSGIGYIGSWAQSVNGPLAAGGYTPLIYSPSKNGDYYFEFADDASGNTGNIDGKLLRFFDITVVQNSTLAVDGRVWSKAWQFYNQTVAPDAAFFLYSEDGIVSRLNINGWTSGVWMLYANQNGCGNTGNWLADRKSMNDIIQAAWPGVVAQSKVFLNDPDINVFPTGDIGGICSMLISFNCNGGASIMYGTNKNGLVLIGIDLPPGGANNGEDVTLVSSATGNFPCNMMNLEPWNGLDGFGNPVPDGTMAGFSFEFLNGLTNLPLYDIETNNNGILVEQVRPVLSGGQTHAALMWNDSDLPSMAGTTLTNLEGCIYPGTSVNPPYNTIEGCHNWPKSSSFNNHGDHDMINTWWYYSMPSSLNPQLEVKRTPETPVFLSPIYTEVCSGQEVTYSVLIPSAEEYHWTLPDGSTQVTSVPEISVVFSPSPPPVTLSVYGTNSSCGTGPSQSLAIMVYPFENPMLSGEDSVCSGNTFTYITTPGQAGYTWSVSPGGSIVGGGTSADSFVSVAWNTIGTEKVKVSYNNPGGCVTPDSLLIVVEACKDLNLRLFLEGFYAGAGIMNPSYDASGIHFGPDITDQVLVELRNSQNYNEIIYSKPNVNLSTSGYANIEIPPSYSGEYFVTIRHRNHFETTTALPVSFAGSSIIYDFSMAASKAYGNNQKEVNGVFMLYGGDINQDGLSDLSDMLLLDNDNILFITGYLASDLDGSGYADSSDMIIVDNNTNAFVQSVLPNW